MKETNLFGQPLLLFSSLLFSSSLLSEEWIKLIKSWRTSNVKFFLQNASPFPAKLLKEEEEVLQSKRVSERASECESEQLRPEHRGHSPFSPLPPTNLALELVLVCSSWWRPSTLKHHAHTNTHNKHGEQPFSYFRRAGKQRDSPLHRAEGKQQSRGQPLEDTHFSQLRSCIAERSFLWRSRKSWPWDFFRRPKEEWKE